MNNSTWIYENWVSKHFVISLNYPCPGLFTVLFADVIFFFLEGGGGVVLWLGICVEVAVAEISRIRALFKPSSLPS